MTDAEKIEKQLRSALDPTALDWIPGREDIDWKPFQQSISYIAELLERPTHIPRTKGNKAGVPCVYHFNSYWLGVKGFESECWGQQPFYQTASRLIRGGASPAGLLKTTLRLTWEEHERDLAKSLKKQNDNAFHVNYGRIREISVILLENEGTRWFAVAWGAQYVRSIGTENIPFRYYGKIVDGELSTITMETGSDATPFHKIYKAESAEQMEARYQKIEAERAAEAEAEARRSAKSD